MFMYEMSVASGGYTVTRPEHLPWWPQIEEAIQALAGSVEGSVVLDGWENGVRLVVHGEEDNFWVEHRDRAGKYLLLIGRQSAQSGSHSVLLGPELPARFRVSVDEALAVAHVFFETGERDATRLSESR